MLSSYRNLTIMWMQRVTCFWLALCAGWLKLDVLVHALKQTCWYYVEVPFCCLVLWWHMRDIRSKCFTSLGICKWYHWHSSGIWPKRTQDWQVQVWVKELDGTWVWSHSRSREAACKYHAMAMWSGCMMQVKVSAVAMLLTLFAMIDENWVLVQSSAVLVLKASRAAVLDWFCSSLWRSSAVNILSGRALHVASGKPPISTIKKKWQACWPSNCYLDWKNEKGFIWSLLHYMAQERLMCFWGVVKPWSMTGKCVWNVPYKMSELVYEVPGHCVGGVSMVLLNHPIFLKARIWRLVERMFPCQHYEVLVCLLSMDCDREYLLGCSLWLSHGLSGLVWYQDTGGGVSMALLNHPIFFGLQLYWGWVVGCSMWLSHPKCFSLFGFSFCCGWARSHPRLLWLGLLPRHVCGENVSVLVPVAPVCLLSRADGHDVIWRFYCGCLQYDAVPSYWFRGASWPYRRSAWEECFDVPLRASKSLGRWAKYPVAFSMASVGNPF